MILLDCNKEELSSIFNTMPKFKVTQLYKWLNKGANFDEMTDIAKPMREALAKEHLAQPVVMYRRFVSKDGTEKYLFKLSDGNLIEGVLMRYKYGNTLCVSTQVGCRMGCKFCASTLDGLVRNLSAGEILGQVVAVNKFLGGDLVNRQVTNVVLMGSGEPLDNFDNVLKFLYLVNNEDGLNISHRNISVSTCGIVPNMQKLADLNLQVNLTISLHSPWQSKRVQIMPIGLKYPLTQVIEAARYYFIKTGRRVIFEYTLIDGVNDTDEDARELCRLVRGFSSHINLIRLNPVKERDLIATTSEHANEFLKKLTEMGLSATLRRQMGVDIDGACGQLRRRVLKDETN